jgi:CubicO group peptidase (beta-lactamase class C family)
MKIRGSGGGYFLAAVLVLSIGWLVFYARGTVAREANKRVERLADKGIFSGAILAVRDGKVVFARAYGMADGEKKIPNTLETRFRIGSITKVFTAILVMQLEGEHRLALTDSICLYRDECPPGWADIKLHHLLSHTSGIADYLKPPQSQADEVTVRNPPHAEDLKRFLHEPLAFAPGEKFAYSNSNFRLLAGVVERVTHHSYEEVLHQRILDVVGMQNTGITREWQAMPNAAVGYRITREGKVKPAPVINGDWLSGDAALYSTVGDLQKFGDALESGKLIPRAAFERMRAPVKDYYGYGWQIQPVSRMTFNRKVGGHAGVLPGFLAAFMRFEDEKVTLIALSNKQVPGVQQALQAAGSAVFGEPFTPSFERERVEVPLEVLKRYVGDYELGGELFTLYLRDGHLFVRDAKGLGPEMPLVATGEEVFFVDGADGDLTVVRGSKGNVMGISADRGDGNPVFAKKVR